MVDLECMVKSLRLAWLNRIFSGNNGTWKSYVPTTHNELRCGIVLFKGNYNISDYTIPSQFYRELLLWWSQFRETFATEEDWKTIIWLVYCYLKTSFNYLKSSSSTKLAIFLLFQSLSGQCIAISVLVLCSLLHICQVVRRQIEYLKTNYLCRQQKDSLTNYYLSYLKTIFTGVS